MKKGDVVFLHKIRIGNCSPEMAKEIMKEVIANCKIELNEKEAINIFIPVKDEESSIECIYPTPYMPIQFPTEMKFSKIRDVKSPTRGTEQSAGIDFFIPEDFSNGLEYILGPGQSVLIPSGIKVNVPDGYALIAFNKSGIATKKNLQVGACVVDSDYMGEVHIHMTNVGTSDAIIKAGDKIVQFILLPVLFATPVELDIERLYDKTTERGERGFGEGTGNV